MRWDISDTVQLSWLFFFLSIRGVHEHASWAQLRTSNVRPECAWTASETCFTSPRWCPSDVRPSRAWKGAPLAALSSAYLISRCCQSAHKPRPLNPPRPSGRTEPRAAPSCRLMHTRSQRCVCVCEWKERQILCIYGRVILSHIWPMGLYSCVNTLYRGVLFINFKFAFIFIIVVLLSRPKCHKLSKADAKRIKKRFGIFCVGNFNIYVYWKQCHGFVLSLGTFFSRDHRSVVSSVVWK